MALITDEVCMRPRAACWRTLLPTASLHSKGVLLFFEFAENIFFGFRRKIERDLTLGPPQEKGAEPGGQTGLGLRILAAVEAFAEVFTVAEDSRHRKGHQAPDIE